MKVLIASILYVALSGFVAIPCRAQWNYPPTKTVDAADTYFGHTYKDLGLRRFDGHRLTKT